MTQAKGGKKGRKRGRNPRYCPLYEQLDTATQNQLLQLRRHLRQERHTADQQAHGALKRWRR